VKVRIAWKRSFKEVVESAVANDSEGLPREQDSSAFFWNGRYINFLAINFDDAPHDGSAEFGVLSAI
jgi:hypothetical protein